MHFVHSPKHILRVLVRIDTILTLTLVNIQLVHRVSRTRNVHFPTAYVDVLLDIGSVNNAFRPCSRNARFLMFIASVARALFGPWHLLRPTADGQTDGVC